MNSYKINIIAIVGVYDCPVEYIVHADDVLTAIQILTDKTEYCADEIVSIYMIEDSRYPVEVLRCD